MQFAEVKLWSSMKKYLKNVVIVTFCLSFLLKE